MQSARFIRGSNFGQDGRVPRGVYRLMSLTGANLYEALWCWNVANSDFQTAVQLYVERVSPQRQLFKPPVSFREDNVEEDSTKGEDNLLHFVRRLIDPGLHFMKGALAAAVVLIAIDAI